MENTKYIPTDVADQYQPLFDLMSKDHDLILTISEMDEIIRTSQNVVNSVNNLQLEHALRSLFNANDSDILKWNNWLRSDESKHL